MWGGARAPVTTHHSFVETLRARGDVTVLTGLRFVRDGNVVTAAGVSAGIDMALWIVGQLRGLGSLARCSTTSSTTRRRPTPRSCDGTRSRAVARRLSARRPRSSVRVMVVDRRAGWVLAWMLDGLRGRRWQQYRGAPGARRGRRDRGRRLRPRRRRARARTDGESMTGSASATARAPRAARARRPRASVSESASESGERRRSSDSGERRRSGLTSDGEHGDDVSSETEGDSALESTDASTGMLSGEQRQQQQQRGGPGC
jgi:hypothetical protein